MIDAARLVDELVASLALAAGAESVILLVGKDRPSAEASQVPLLALLRVLGRMNIEELGIANATLGPRAWADKTRERAADAFSLMVDPGQPLAVRSFGRRINGEREHLRSLRGPLLLFMSADDERTLREVAPDFFTWIAQIYEMPPPAELLAHAKQVGAVIDATASLQLPSTAASATATVTAPPLRFLHFSDVHFKTGAAKEYDRSKVLQGLLERLEREREKSPLDLVFFTGDLAFGGDAKEYAAAVELLRRLLDVTGLDRDRLFVVPGNHDVDRRVGRWLLRSLRSNEDSNEFFLEAEHRKAHEAKFANYRKGLGDLLGEARPLGLGVGGSAVEFVEVRGVKLAVASFNSAWFAVDDSDVGQLWLGEANVDRAVDRIEAERGVFAAIALMHHPTDYLSETERSAIEKHLERSFDIVLRGHLHSDKAKSVLTPRGGYVELAAPAAYQGSQWPNGCFVGEIHAPPARELSVRAYKFGSGADPWTLDHAVFPDDEDGRHTFALRERRRGGAILKSLPTGVAGSLVSALDRPTTEGIFRTFGARGDARAERDDILSNKVDVRDLLDELGKSGGKLPRTLQSLLVSRLAATIPAPPEPLAPWGPRAFEALLERLVAYWSAHRADWISALGEQEIVYALFAGAFFERQSGQPIDYEVRAGSTRVDLVIGSGEGRAAVEIKSGKRAEGALSSVEQRMNALQVNLGAVLRFEQPGQEQNESPRVGPPPSPPERGPLRVVDLGGGRLLFRVTL